MKNTDKLIKAFKATGEEESEKIELDNLDWARLVYNEDKQVVVENEHGSQFEVTDLSKIEVKIFLANIGEPKFCCTNCGGGFNRVDMVFDEENENDFCTDCAK
jgi:hypothetical protein